MNIRILGAHARETASSKCVSILVDGILAIDAGALTSSLDISEQQRLEAVLLTHAHYDHLRDIPSLALNLFRECAQLQLYCTEGVRQAIQSHLLNGVLYPRFEELVPGNPTVIFNRLKARADCMIGRYKVSAIPMHHPGAAVGYHISNGSGHSLFYSGDTGSFPSGCWRRISPDLLIVEVTFPDRLESLAKASCHLTPRLLQEGLDLFRRQAGYLPRIVVVHMDPSLEDELSRELATVSTNLGAQVTVAREGMELTLDTLPAGRNPVPRAVTPVRSTWVTRC
ncbi:MAG: hypothetical protein A2147_00865 [Chloroflexi bacterium RBG_16_57_8]|nr:MAG: hypothetical protein A2147_00865 [Chloroflexi bacterium RBG_16_57_8]